MLKNLAINFYTCENTNVLDQQPGRISLIRRNGRFTRKITGAYIFGQSLQDELVNLLLDSF